MLARCLRITFLLGLIAAVAAGSAAAHSMNPDQHDAQELEFGEALLGFDPDAALPASMSRRCEDGMAGPYPCRNVDLEGFVPLPMLGGATGNDIWGWTDPETGREYAIMGTSNSTGFVDVTDPQNPVLVGVLPTAGIPDFVLWRDIKVDGNYAFIVSEVTGAGMQVFDLTRLRDADGGPQMFDEDAFYDGVSYSHNISINEQTDVAYIVGSNKCDANGERGGLHMVDIGEPLSPQFLGCATVEHMSGDEPDNYVHDVECVVYDGPDPDYQNSEICFGSNENVVAIYDVSDKSSPQVISVAEYPQAQYTHQGALTEDKRYFLFGDELDEQRNGQNTTTYILDVSDLDNPPTPKAYEHPSASIDHNMYTHDGRAYQSNYMEGLRILEYDNASLAAGQLNEVAYFDVVPGGDFPEFAGTWSNYRFPSGTTVVSTIENEVNGLFVLRPQLGSADGAAGPPDSGGSAGSGGSGSSSPGAQPEPEGDSGDRRKPKMRLRLRRAQDIDKLRVRVKPNETVDVVAGARVSIGRTARTFRFRKARKRVAAGERTKLRLKLRRRAERKVKRAIRRGERPRARVVVRAKDMSGNAIAKKRRVRLKR